MNTGWVKLHRRFLQWEWYGDHKVVALFIHCLLKANHKEKNWRGNTIPRGTFITSYDSLKNETGLSVRELRTAFKKLEETGEIDKRSTSVNSWVTVVNYDKYQDIDKRETSERQSSDKRETTTNNDKNVKNDKKNIPTLAEVKQYFIDNGYDPQVAEKAYNIYNASVEDHPQRKYWRDSRDNLIKNWKLKMQSVWFKEENKVSQNGNYQIPIV